MITRSFTASLPALEANPKRVLTAPFDLAAGIGGLLDSLIGDPTLIKSLFSADTYGGTEPGDNSDDVGLGSVAVETGEQLGFPDEYDRERHVIRSVAIPSCEAFGVPIAPGCLATVLEALREPAGAADGGGSGGGSDGAGGGDDTGDSPSTPGPDEGGGGSALDELEDELGIDLGLGELGEGLNETLEGLGIQNPGAGGQAPNANAVQDLLDFLLRP